LDFSATDGGESDQVLRAARRAEKQRRTRASSIESAEVHEAARRSLEDRGATERSYNEWRPPVWDDVNLRAAYAALERERHTTENSLEFKRRQAALIRNANELLAMRVSEDHAFATEVQAQIAQMEADRELAESIAAKEQEELDSRRRRLAKAQQALDKESAAIKQVEKRGSQSQYSQEPRTGTPRPAVDPTQ
jgi:hypothetical protein